MSVGGSPLQPDTTGGPDHEESVRRLLPVASEQVLGRDGGSGQSWALGMGLAPGLWRRWGCPSQRRLRTHVPVTPQDGSVTEVTGF